MPIALRPGVGAGVPLSALAALIGAVPAEGSNRPGATPDLRVTGVTLRAQYVLPGDLFAALAVSSTHGARYTGAAVERGAVAVLTDPAGVAEISSHDAPVLIHPVPRTVLGELAATVYGHPSERLAVVGITGTSGKTTTTYLIEAGLRAAGRSVGLVGTIGIRINGTDLPSTLTTPEAPMVQAQLAAMAERGIDTVVMEVSSHALRLGRVDGVRFAVGGFTNLSRDHLDFHPSMADYFEAKARLFDPASRMRAATAIICVDYDAGRAMADRAEKAVTVSAAGGAADWRAEDLAADAAGQQFTAVDPAGVRHRLAIGLPGRYNVANCLVALAIMDVLGVSPEQASTGLRDTSVPGRLEQIDRGQDFLALVDYAHKPGALRAVLQALRQPGRRLAVVFGAGGGRDPGKRAPMGAIAAELADLVVVTDDNPRDEDPVAIRREILSGATQAGSAAQIVELGDRRAAIRHAVAWAKSGDVVLVTGKGHETGQNRGGRILPFDDRVEVAAALATHR